jgi:signal recognition particle subunit SRP54
MFETLSQKLGGIFGRLRGRGRLSEKDVTEALREVRVALLEADVNYKVVKEFVRAVTERAVGEKVWEALEPDQQVVKIVRDHMVELLGGAPVGRPVASEEPPPNPPPSSREGVKKGEGFSGPPPQPSPASGGGSRPGDSVGRPVASNEINWAASGPTVFLLCGLQGSGKTTTAAKLAKWLQGQGKKPILAACDLQRPAAVRQLQVLGEQIGVPVVAVEGETDPVKVAVQAKKEATDVLIVDTAGRLQIDDDLMRQVKNIKQAVGAHETLLVVDGTAGQESVNVAEAFNQQLGIDGVILTKMDGDARGGAALSIRAVCGKPIRFVGVGEKTDALEPFYPDRAAGRILGMGDVLSLIETAEAAFDLDQAKQLEAKLRSNTLNFEDMLSQFQMIKKMGSLEKIMDMIPGMSQMKGAHEAMQGKQMQRVEALILSMTPQERRHPELLNGSRKRRIAAGSGSKPEDVNALISQLQQMRQMMKGMMGMQKRMKRTGKKFR